jgi:hypothetical protein
VIKHRVQTISLEVHKELIVAATGKYGRNPSVEGFFMDAFLAGGTAKGLSLHGFDHLCD